MTPPCLFSSTSPRHSTLLTVEFCWRDCKSCSVSAAFTTAAVCLQCRRSSRVLRKEVGAHNSTSPWGVGGSCAEHLTVESYTIIISLQSYLLLFSTDLAQLHRLVEQLSKRRSKYRRSDLQEPRRYECSLSGRGQGHVSNFYIVDLENFATASRQYTGDIRNSPVAGLFISPVRQWKWLDRVASWLSAHVYCTSAHCNLPTS